MWDFDGTLAQRPGRWSRCLAETLAAIAPDAAVSEDRLKPGLRGGFFWHRHDQPHDHLSDPELWWNELHPVLVGAYVGAEVDHDLADQAARQVRQDYTDPKFWTVYDDTIPALSATLEAGWSNVIVSNHVPELPQLIMSLGLDSYLLATVNSATAGWEKPHPEIFRIALERSGRPQDVRMIGDNPMADVAGAEAAGIPGILVRTTGPQGEPPLGLHEALDIILT